MADVAIFLSFEPLANAGILSLTREQNHFCPVCIYHVHRQGRLEQFVSEEDGRLWQEKVARLVSHLFTAFKERTKAFALKTESGTDLVMTGDQALIEHGELHHHSVPLSKRILTQARRKTRTPLTFNQLKRTLVLNEYIERIINDLTISDYHALNTGSSYLTSRAIDIELLSLLGSSSTSANVHATNALMHSVPFMRGLPLSRLLKLRKSEADAFAVYRDAIGTLVRQEKRLSPKDLAAAVRDTVIPELNKIERMLKNARRVSSKGLTQDIVVGAGSVTAGAFLGLLPPTLAAIVATLGGYTGLKGAFEKVTNLWRPPGDVLNNRYYFLWKASKAGR